MRFSSDHTRRMASVVKMSRKMWESMIEAGTRSGYLVEIAVENRLRLADDGPVDHTAIDLHRALRRFRGREDLARPCDLFAHRRA